MFKLNAICTNFVFSFFILVCFPAQAIDIGQSAPEFALHDTANAVKLNDFKGKVIYLDFWASWCDPCKKSFPWMNAMQSKYGPNGFVIIAINLDANNADGNRFLKSMPVNFEVVFDSKGQLARQFQVKGMPSSILINRNGQVVLQHAGFNDAIANQLELEIASLTKGK